MKLQKDHGKEQEQQGAPEWMVTFSDCMTLLLTFFVLLLTFSSFDEFQLRYFKVVFVRELSSLSLFKGDKSSIVDPIIVQHLDDLNKGSEKPTLKRGSQDNLLKEEAANIHSMKVFLRLSDNIFWGNGAIMSLQGRKALSHMASFLKEVPNRVVISENGPSEEQDNEHLGLRRAWAVQDYFVTKHGLDKNRFNITARSLQKNLESGSNAGSGTKSERMLEIVLLERSIFN